MRIRRAAVGAIVALAVAVPPANACSGAQLKLGKRNADRVARATVCLLNRERSRAGLHRLRADRKLRAAAARHSDDMVSRRYFEHDGPAGDTLVSRARSARYLTGNVLAWSLGENIAFGRGSRGTPAAIVKAWMRSPVHRAIILTPIFRSAGVGLAQGTPSGRGGATYTLDVGFVRR